MSFCYLSNTAGFTGDWFTGNIKDLAPSPSLSWQYHCFAPFAVFPDLADGRYVKETGPYRPGSSLDIPLIGLNDTARKMDGTVRAELTDPRGKVVAAESTEISIEPHWQAGAFIRISLPETPGNYLLLVKTEADDPHARPNPAISRRYLRVGEPGGDRWPAVDPGM